MSTMWFPPGWIVDVENPGFGEMRIDAPTDPHNGKALVVEHWSKDLYGGDIGVFLSQVTTRAFDDDTAPLPADTTLPPFATPKAARDLLPALQQGAVLAAAGSDRHERVFPDPDEPPAKPLCVRCNLGTYYTPGPLPSEWCERHDHRPFGWNGSPRWGSALELHRLRRQRWDAEQKWKALTAGHRAAIAPRPIR